MKRKSNHGAFVVIEGTDGSGKSTAADNLEALAVFEKYQPYITREPTLGPFGSEIRAILRGTANHPGGLEFQRLFAKDRLWHITHTLIPNLNRGRLVICDRYWMSSLAYGTADGTSLKLLIDLHQEVVGTSFLRPDITFLLDLPAEVALGRKEKKSLEYFEKLSSLKKVRKNYLKLRKELGNNTVVIDATLSPEELANEIWKHITSSIPSPYKMKG